MTCTFCKAAIPAAAKYCPQCGTVVADAGGPTTYDAEQDSPYAMPRTPSGYATMGQETSTMAVVSLVAGILGWTVFFVVGAIAAVITGHMARREIRESYGRLGGDAMAMVGLVLGYAQVVLLVLALAVVLVVVIGLAAAS